MDEIEQAKGYAARGHSFSFTAQLLGMDRRRLRRLLEENGADIQFVDGKESLAAKRRLEELHKTTRGRPASSALRAAGDLGRKKFQEGLKRYTAFGVTGTLVELYKYFDCPVSDRSLRSRLEQGMSIEDALTRPRRKYPKGVIPPQFAEQVEKQRRLLAVRILDQIERRLTSSMLQYRSTGHDIVETGRDSKQITVEVREKNGTVLHRLRFAPEFRSGVLFVFDPLVRGRIQFIAFEPNHKTLQRSHQAISTAKGADHD